MERLKATGAGHPAGDTENLHSSMERLKADKISPFTVEIKNLHSSMERLKVETPENYGR